MYSSYTRLPVPWGSRSETSVPVEARYLNTSVDLSSSFSQPAFAVHAYDSPVSEFFRRRVVVDTYNTGIVSFAHPVANLWNATSVPYFYHIPITIRALNPAAMIFLSRIRDDDKSSWSSVLRMRLYGVQQRSCFANRNSVSRLLPFSLRSFRLISQDAGHYVYVGNGDDSVLTRSYSLASRQPIVAQLLPACSINYTRLSRNTLFAKVQIPVRDMCRPDDGSHSFTTIDEMNEVDVARTSLVVPHTSRPRSALWLENKFIRSEVSALVESGDALCTKPWFEMPNALRYAETYVNQHMLPLPTMCELRDVVCYGLLRDDYYTEHGIPGNLMRLPLYRRELGKHTCARQPYSVFSSDATTKCRRHRVQLLPTLERHTCLASVRGERQVCCTECVQLFRLNGSDLVHERNIQQAVDRQLGRAKAVSSHLACTQVFYTMVGRGATAAYGTPLAPQDVVFVLSLEVLPM